MKKSLGVLFLFFSITGFLYAQSPSISSINKIDGTLNSKVEISGTNFSTNPANLAVWFGGSRGTVIQSTENFIEVSVPAGTTTSSIIITNTLTGLTGYSSSLFNLNYSGAPGTIDFSSLQVSDFNSVEEIFDLELCDFDLDGLNDVATSKIGEFAGDLAIFHNTSTLNSTSFTLLNKISNPEFDIKNPTSNVTSGDVDGDGKPDLLATRSGATANQIYVWRNISTTGSIKFANQKSYFINPGQIAKTIKLRDLDGDGKPELVVANNENSEVLVFRNTSTKGNINFVFTPVAIDIPGATSANGLDIEDLNSDGKAEIITNPLFEPNVFIQENLSTKGNFNFGDPIVLNLSGSPNSLVVGDLNRDGLSDIIVTKTQESKIAFFLNNSTGSIQFQNALEFDTSTRPWGLDLGDLNGDGLLDVVTTSISSNEGTYLQNKSTSTALDFDVSPVPQTRNSRNVKIGDLSGDGKPDVAMTSFSTGQFRLTTFRINNCMVPTIQDAPDAICNGQTIRLNATPGLFVDYVWYKGGVEIKNSTDSFLDITSEGTYSVTAVSENSTCSEPSEDFTITLGTGGLPPDIENTATNNGPVCPGESVNLSIETVAGATYLWSGPNNFSSTDQNPVLSNLNAEMSGIYSAVIFLGECQSLPATTIVEVISPPDFSIQASGPTRFCEGGSVILSTNSETGYTFQWIKDGVAITDATSTTYTANSPGDYSVQVSSTTVSCNVATEVITVSTYTPPQAQFSFSGTQCATNDIQFTDQSVVLPEFTSIYSWDFGDGSTSAELNPIHAFTAAGEYTVVLSVTYEGQSCMDSETGTISISEPTPFTITVTGDTEFCNGGNTTLSVTGSFTSFDWSTGDTESEIVVSASGTYSVTATNTAGCPSTDQIDITVFDLPIVTISPDSVVIQLGDTVQLIASGADTYSWTPSETLSDSTASNPIASPLSTTIYTVTGTDINGCIDTAESTVKVDTESGVLPVQAPKLFSPNGDSIDDEWIIGNSDNFPECKVLVFSRNGTTVYEASLNVAWNGTYKGEPLPEGAYYYVISCPDGKSKTGSVAIIK